jgi:hypothetical protein
MKKLATLLCVVAVVAMWTGAGVARAGIVVEYDAVAAGAGNEPQDVVPPWTKYGVGNMVNNGTYLLQDWTADDPTTQSGEYDSPAVPGLMARNVNDYSVEFRVRPLTDMPFLGSSHFANCKIGWKESSASSLRYNISIDLDEDDTGPLTTGALRYGDNSLAPVITGIDWSVPHTVAVAYRASADDFEFYFDGVYAATLAPGTFGRIGGGMVDGIRFGDGTTGQGLDVAAEWYFARIYDVAVPEPSTLALLGFAGVALAVRRGRRTG